MNQHKLPYWYHFLTVLLAFYVSSFIAGGFLSLAIEQIGINTFASAIILGFAGCLFFIPILLIISIIIWGMAHPIKYFISFLLITAYGGFIPFLAILIPFLMPTIILFFILLIWLIKRFSQYKETNLRINIIR